MKPKKTINKVSRTIYKDILVAPLESCEKPLYINSYFSGVGGFDNGAKRAGFRIKFHSDISEFEENPTKVIHTNSKKTFITKSIAELCFKNVIKALAKNNNSI